jgi:hypothetical protein
MATSQAPSLGELSNINVDPERGTGTPAVVFTGGQEMVNNLNQNARFEADNDMKKYQLFQNNLKEAYARGDAIAATDVAPQDREAIQKRLADVMGEIGKNPKDFFKGGANATKLTEALQKVQIDANKSKQDRIYDIAHRDFLERNPNLQTDENKKRIEDFSNKSLEDRKPFILEMPPVVDIGKLKDDIIGSDGVTTTGIGARPYGTDGKFNQTYETKSVKYEPFKQKWNLAIDLHPEIKRYAQNLFSKLPPEQQKQTNVSDYWSALGDRAFGQKGDYNSESNGKLVANPFALEADKNKDKLEQIKASTKPQLLRAYDYHRLTNAKLQGLKDEKARDAEVKNIWINNVKEQKELVTPMGAVTNGTQGLGFTMLPASESLPMHTFDAGKVGLLKPFNAIPVYVKDAKGQKFAGWKGGTYKQHYYSGNTETNPGDMFDTYNKIRKKYSPEQLKKAGMPDFNSFIKEQVKNGNYKLKLEGENGSTDEDVESSALRAISNADTKKGQEGVFDISRDEPYTLDADGHPIDSGDNVTSEVTSSSTITPK